MGFLNGGEDCKRIDLKSSEKEMNLKLLTLIVSAPMPSMW